MSFQKNTSLVMSLGPRKNVPVEIKGWVGLMWGRHFESIVARIPNHVFVVDDDLCYGCGACIALCPVDALNLESLLAIVDEPTCTHCEHCIPACPVFALDIVPEVPA